MLKRLGAFSAVVLCSMILAGCMRREGRNADCQWPGEISGRSAGVRNLSADAEFAEGTDAWLRCSSRLRKNTAFRWNLCRARLGVTGLALT
jgi:predicted small secreted protein